MFRNSLGSHCNSSSVHSCNTFYLLQWRHNGPDGVSNHQPRDCLLNRLFRRRSKNTSKLRVTGLCVGNSPATGVFSAQKASNAENVSIWWRHHAVFQVTWNPLYWCGLNFIPAWIRNYSFIEFVNKLLSQSQTCNRRSLGMDQKIHITFYLAYDYLSMQGSKLISAGHRWIPLT